MDDQKIGPQKRIKGEVAFIAEEDPKELSLPYGVIAKTVGVVLAITLFCMFVSYVFFGAPRATVNADNLRTRKMSFPPLETNPANTMKEFLKQENDRLSSYGWVDKAKGKVHVPIEKAMDMIVERGLPTRTK